LQSEGACGDQLVLREAVLVLSQRPLD
jgi:hypothetical protein